MPRDVDVIIEHDELVIRMMTVAFGGKRETAEWHVEHHTEPAKAFSKAARVAVEYFTECMNHTMPASLQRVPRGEGRH